MQTLTSIASEVHANAVAHGFHPEGQPLDTWLSNMCNNLTGEVSELWDAARKGGLNLPCDKPIGLTCAEEELADIIIRACDMSKRLGVDIQRAVEVKHQYNLTRPFKHGKLN